MPFQKSVEKMDWPVNSIKKKMLSFRKKAWIPIPYLTPKQISERLVLMVKT